MAVRFKLDVKGIESLRDDVQDKADRIVERAARRIERKAKIYAPVDTGILRDSITVEDTGKGKRKIGPTVDYGLFQELGTSRNPARPYLGPAYEEEKRKLEQDLRGLV